MSVQSFYCCAVDSAGLHRPALSTRRRLSSGPDDATAQLIRELQDRPRVNMTVSNSPFLAHLVVLRPVCHAQPRIVIQM